MRAFVIVASCFLSAFAAADTLRKSVRLDAKAWRHSQSRPKVLSTSAIVTNPTSYLVYTYYGSSCNSIDQVISVGFGVCFAQDDSTSFMYVQSGTNWIMRYYETRTNCTGTSVNTESSPCSQSCANYGSDSYLTSSTCQSSPPSALLYPSESSALYPSLSMCQAGGNQNPLIQINQNLACVFNGTTSTSSSCSANSNTFTSTTYIYSGNSCNGKLLSTDVYTGTQCDAEMSSIPGTYPLGTCAAAPTKAPLSSTAAPSSPSAAPSAASAACFAGSESILLESGETVSISSLKVGDRVLAADTDGKTAFSDVVFIPHGRNNEHKVFSEIRTATGRDIKLTPDHLILAGACDSAVSGLKFAQAQGVQIGSCVLSVNGLEEVVSNNLVDGFGIYTFVTMAKLVVVNGIVASPFAGNHAVASAFYNIHRTLYTVAPFLLQMDWVQQANLAFGSVVTAFSA